MRRVMIIGSPGAGKSTFARALARKTDLPLTHLDDAYWRPGWVRPPRVEWEAKLRELAAEGEWILDGNYTSTLEMRAERADHAIVLAYPRALCLTRAVSRALLQRRPDRKDLGQEPLDREFLRFIWTFPALGRRQLARLQDFQHLKIIVLHGDHEAKRFLQQLQPHP